MTERKQHPLALAAALAGLISTPALAGELSLSGEGSVRYEPDSVRLQFTASAEHALAARASEQVQALMERWRSGIEPWRERLDGYSDARLNLYTRTLPATERNEPPRQQAVASQTVSFNLHDLSLLNPILAKAQALGFTYNLGPQNFYHSDQAQLERQALAQAIARCPQPLRVRSNRVGTELRRRGHHEHQRRFPAGPDDDGGSPFSQRCGGRGGGPGSDRLGVGHLRAGLRFRNPGCRTGPGTRPGRWRPQDKSTCPGRSAAPRW